MRHLPVARQWNRAKLLSRRFPFRRRFARTCEEVVTKRSSSKQRIISTLNLEDTAALGVRLRD